MGGASWTQHLFGARMLLGHRLPWWTQAWGQLDAPQAPLGQRPRLAKTGRWRQTTWHPTWIGLRASTGRAGSAHQGRCRACSLGLA